MFYDIFYKLMSDIIGDTAMTTAQGVMFATYGSYIFCVVVIIVVFSIVLKLGNWLINLFR
jgi:hypothetical protein